MTSIENCLISQYDLYSFDCKLNFILYVGHLIKCKLMSDQKKNVLIVSAILPNQAMHVLILI